ncbi:MAG: cysteine desulfurase [Ignavibacteriales bacterium]|nr:cysteine desulfurase [Ignavibacteriales bacterium]
MFNTEKIISDFPILQRKVNGGKRLVYLDSAATSQKPLSVIKAMDDYYRLYNANVHRGVYSLGYEATEAYELSRKKVAKFINAQTENIIFTRNASEAINLVASSWGRANFRSGDEILLTPMEHHSNLIPWQLIAQQTGAKLKFIPLIEPGILDIEQLPQLISEKTKFVSVVHSSNTLGTINPIEKIISHAHAYGAKILIDASQSVPHFSVDVQKLDCDFLVFSGHKMCAPTGIGCLFGKTELLDAMPPYMGGGEMISEVQLEFSSYREIPWKFEAGTPNISAAIGLGVAVDYLSSLGMYNIRQHEIELTNYALSVLQEVDEIEMYGPTENRGGVISFNIGDAHAHDVSTILDEDGICVRAGHNCTQPLVRWLGVPAVARASFYVYNTKEDVDALAASLKKVQEVFSFAAAK